MNDKEIALTLKELREKNGLSVKTVIHALHERGKDISDKTLYSYESGKRMPNADMLILLCRIYKVDNVLKTFGFSDVTSDGIPILTYNEINHIEKYRAIDEDGKTVVDAVLNREYEQQIKQEQFLNAAHERTDAEFTEEDRLDDERMIDEDED